MKKAILAVCVIACIAVAAFFIVKGRSNGPKYKVEKPQKGEIVFSVSATGTVNPVNTILIGTQVSGTIKKLFADYNSEVRENQVIALIDPALFRAQLEQANANLLQAIAEVEKSEAALLNAQRTMVRTKELFGKHFVAQSELDTAETSEVSAKAQLSLSKAKVAQMKAAADLADTNLRYTKITSPVNGVVISRNVSEGQTVAASFQTPTLFTIGVDLTKMQIDTNIAEADIGRIREGMPVEFRVDAYSDRVFHGVVQQVRNAAVTIQNVVTYDVVVMVENKEMLLKPGMTANVSVIIERRKDVLKVPNAAFRFIPAGAEKFREPSIWVLSQGEPKRVPVKKGLSDGTSTEVESTSLSENSEVVLESLVKAAKPPSMPGMPR
jgi:HlyD family secretion protein